MKDKEYIPYTDKCFACGENNPDGIRLRMYRSGERVRAEAKIEERFNGYERVAHGGVVCALLDEAMIWAAVVFGSRRTMYVTVEITISYLAPVPTKEEISVEGWITRDRGRVVECESVVTCKSKPLARGRGKFIDMGSDKLREAKPGIKFDRAPSFKDFFLTRES
jgi:uncharacterized protein (TIGR00369 family)